MEKIGADAVIAEGMETGGHIGKFSTMTLVRQVAAAVSIPVIALEELPTVKVSLQALCLVLRPFKLVRVS